MLANTNGLSRRFGVLLMFWASLAAAQSYHFAGGTGEPNDPYQIATAEQLISIGSDPNLLDKCFILNNDIDLDPNLPGSHVFTQSVVAPNREDTFGFRGTPFTGAFNGRGYTVRNLTIRPAMGYYMGLFGKIEVEGWVKDLGVEDVSISSAHYRVGGLAAINRGTIIHCHATGSIRAGNGAYIEDLGGLVGINDGRIYHSCASVDIFGNDRSHSVGGLVGTNLFGRIATCYADGRVSGHDPLGGLVANNVEGTITDCYAIASVSSGDEFSLHMGGLVGYNQGGTIANCYAAGRLFNGTGRWDWGGLVGSSPIRAVTHDIIIRGVVANCFWDAEVSGAHTSDGGMGLLTSQMQNIETFQSAGWDFEHIWMMSNSKGYPRLQWEDAPIPEEKSRL